MPLIKPGRWSANPADIDPRYLNLWCGLVKLVPFWGDASEIVKRELGTETGGFVPGSEGLAHDNTGAADIAEIPNDGIGFGTGTVLVVFDGTGTPAATGKLVASGTDNNDFQLYRNSSDTIFRLRVGSASGNITVPALWGTGPHVIVGTYDEAAVERTIWVDGVSSAVDTTAFTPVTSWSGPNMVIGNRNEDAARSAGGLFYLAAFWDRVVSPAEIRLLAQDPFSLIRRHEQLFGPTLQYLYPDGDILSGGWESAPTAGQSLFSQIDEDPAVDTDYIFEEV